MTAPKHNQFWKLRSRHGRKKLFKTPRLLWMAACEYFQWCDNHPWMKYEQARGGRMSVVNKRTSIKDQSKNLAELPTARPYTLSGLCLYLNCSQHYFNEFKKNKPSQGFLEVITRIEHIIETQQFEGATVGAYNANIIARKLGLSEKTDITSMGEKITGFNYVVPDDSQH